MATLQFDTYWNLKQKEMFKVLLDNSNWITDIWYGWSAGWWKSYGWVAWQWMMRNRYPWTRWFFGRKELKRLKQTTLATYYKFCDDYQIPVQQRWVFNSQDSVINYENWSKILLLDLAYMPSDPDFQRFWSLEFTDWFADEIAEVDSKCLMILKTRIWRQKNEEYGLLPKFLGTFNPDKWHIYRDYYKPYKENTLPNYRVFIPALATDNKKLPKVYIEQLLKADEVTKQRLLYWNFDYDDTPWRLFEYNSILDMWTNPKNNWKKYISCDVARKWKDKAVIFVWDWLEVIDMIVYDKSTNEEIQDKIKELCSKYSIWMSNVIVDEDWVGGWIVDNLRCRWFINNSSPYSSIQTNKFNDFQKRNYQNLKTQCYFRLAELVQANKIRLNIDWEAKNCLIEELDVIVEIDLDKDDKRKIIKKEDIKEKLWRSPDYSDALMFRCFYELEVLEDNNDNYTHKDETFNPYKDDDEVWRNPYQINFKDDEMELEENEEILFDIY